MDRSAIIIGSGLGGLECGFILARHGLKVTILEQDKHIGGCLQTFRRRTDDGREFLFDTGFHYIGGLGEGNSLHPLFEYFGLLDLPWKRLDEDCFDEAVFVKDKAVETYSLANGHDRFVSSLARKFPSSLSDLRNFASFLKDVGDNIFNAFRGDSDRMNDLFSRSAYEFLNETVHDPELRRVLSGTSLKMELQRDTLPLYIFAQINNSYIQSAHRLAGGGSLIADRLASQIVGMGGTVINKAKVVRILENNGVATGVEYETDGRTEVLNADLIVSDAHPAATVNLIGESKAVRGIYRRRVNGLANTYGMFTANIALKPQSIEYINHNLYVNRSDADLWNPDPSKTESVLVHFYVPNEGKWASHMDLISPMSWGELSSYKDEPRGHRGEAYEAIKRRKAEECISLVERRLPGLRNAIDKVWTSTPLTYLSYTGTSFGSAYGIRKDFNNPMLTVMSPRTPLRNLFLTGQSLNLHGILGVSMTSVLTCSAILGTDAVVSEILR